LERFIDPAVYAKARENLYNYVPMDIEKGYKTSLITFINKLGWSCSNWFGRPYFVDDYMDGTIKKHELQERKKS
jgi:uncharacterized protein (DUF1015 family)